MSIVLDHNAAHSVSMLMLSSEWTENGLENNRLRSLVAVRKNIPLFSLQNLTDLRLVSTS